MSEDTYNFGYIADPLNIVESTLGIPGNVIHSLPDTVDLRLSHGTHYPPVADQGDTSSCTAYASGAAFQFELSKHGCGFETSKLFTYYNTRRLHVPSNVAKDSGANFFDAIQSFCQFGVCDERDWLDDHKPGNYLNRRFPADSRGAKEPYARIYPVASSYKTTIQNVRPTLLRAPPATDNLLWQGGSESESVEGLAANAEALFTRPLEQNLRADWYPLEGDIATLRGCLAEGYPFIFGFSVYNKEWDAARTSGVLDMPSDKEVWNAKAHAAVVVGYNHHDEHFIVRNSFGTGWGREGHFEMPYRYFEELDIRAQQHEGRLGALPYASNIWTLRVEKEPLEQA